MNYLLDTCILIKWLTYSQTEKTLNDEILEIIANEENNVFISIKSFEEIAIKYSIQKLFISNFDFSKVVHDVMSFDFQLLELKITDCKLLSNMPFINNHKDPFDRMLISQAMNNNLIFITSDQKIKVYPEDTYYQNKLNVLFN